MFSCCLGLVLVLILMVCEWFDCLLARSVFCERERERERRKERERERERERIAPFTVIVTIIIIQEEGLGA